MEKSTMSDKDDLDDLKQRAAAVGLTRLTDMHLRQLQRATQRIRQQQANLRVALSVADEPAHVYSLVRKG
jgi:hypothetical protein